MEEDWEIVDSDRDARVSRADEESAVLEEQIRANFQQLRSTRVSQSLDENAMQSIEDSPMSPESSRREDSVHTNPLSSSLSTHTSDTSSSSDGDHPQQNHQDTEAVYQTPHESKKNSNTCRSPYECPNCRFQEEIPVLPPNIELYIIFGSLFAMTVHSFLLSPSKEGIAVF